MNLSNYYCPKTWILTPAINLKNKIANSIEELSELLPKTENEIYFNLYDDPIMNMHIQAINKIWDQEYFKQKQIPYKIQLP